MVAFFTICGPSQAWCEEGMVLARSCAAAEQHIRAGLRRDQTAIVHECRPYQPGDWPRID